MFYDRQQNLLDTPVEQSHGKFIAKTIQDIIKQKS